jgi:sulfoxide reductase heme-binding subunit YedZ
MTIWLVARSSGIAAYVLLTATVLAGLVLRSRPFGRALKAATVTELHRMLALLALVYVAVHGVALLLDRTVEITPAALVVPGLASYRPLAVSTGVLAAELMALVYVSFRFRKRIGTKAWRMLHWLTYLVFAGATAHGLAAGTDTQQAWARGLYLGAVGAVAFATAWRALAVAPARAKHREAA